MAGRKGSKSTGPIFLNELDIWSNGDRRLMLSAYRNLGIGTKLVNPIGTAYFQRCIGQYNVVASAAVWEALIGRYKCAYTTTQTKGELFFNGSMTVYGSCEIGGLHGMALEGIEKLRFGVLLSQIGKKESSLDRVLARMIVGDSGEKKREKEYFERVLAGYDIQARREGSEEIVQMKLLVSNNTPIGGDISRVTMRKGTNRRLVQGFVADD